MPGKVNPVIPEVVTQVAAQVIGNDTAIAIGGMQGHFELNVFVPLMARNLLQSIKLLASACRLLDTKCVAGIEANLAQTERYAEATLVGGDRAQPVHRLRQGDRDRPRRRSPRGARSVRWRGRWASPTRCSTRRSTTARWLDRTADIARLQLHRARYRYYDASACQGRARIGSCSACRRSCGSACTRRLAASGRSLNQRDRRAARGAVSRTERRRRHPRARGRIVRN